MSDRSLIVNEAREKKNEVELLKMSVQVEGDGVPLRSGAGVTGMKTSGVSVDIKGRVM